MHFKRLMCATTAVALSVGATGMTASAMAGTLSGAGSTLVAPLENEWATNFHNSTGNVVNYSAVGSGSGIKAISGNLVDFGASDAPMTSTQAASCSGCLTIPWALSATGVGYNIPGVPKYKLKLSGKVLAGIYLGTINNWDNPAIKKLNKGLSLPNLTITPVFRSDGSGDTYAFTNYLSHVSPTFASKVGYATTVSFPAGVGASGNSGVATKIAGTSGAIGYVAASYLLAQSLPVAAIQNAKGNFEFPNLNQIKNAAATVHSVPSSGGISIVNPPKSQKIAYPISTFTYAIVQGQPKQAALLKQFLTYALTTGRNTGVGLDFAPIPSVVQRAALSMVNSL